MEPRRQGRIRAGRSRQLRRYRYRQEIALAVFTPTQHHQDRCQRVVAEVLADFTDRAVRVQLSGLRGLGDRAGAAAFHGLHWVVPG